MHNPHEPRWILWIRSRRVRRSLILTVLWSFFAVVIIQFRTALLPFGLALLLAFILEPLVDWASQKHIRGRSISRIFAIITTYVVSLALIALLSGWAASQIGQELKGLGKETKAVVNEVRGMMVSVLDWAEEFAVQNKLPVDRAGIELVLEQNLKGTIDEVTQYASSLFTFGRNIVGGTFRAIFGGFLVLMLTAFISMDKRRIEQFFQSLVPVEYQEAYSSVLSKMAVGLAGVVRGQVLICLTNGVLTFIGLWLFDVKLPLLLATVAAVFSLIPIFGSILSTIPIVAMALTESFGKGFIALAWIILIHLVEANVLNPKIMGDAAKIHPVIVVFALIAGEQTAGLIGALFAVPITSVIITIFKFLHAHALKLEEVQT